ncbi:exodeoxyribonuclease III [Parcubacteria bacterium DG_74_2]|nr:MAG: exodeoxyribonuclease III [Parcubacteria bacterium DG_74_2]
MKIISWNVNGIRAACKKNFLDWFKKSKADIICLQEIRAQKEQLPDELLKPKKYYFYFNPAVKKGYSGVIVYSKQKPLKAENKLGFKRFDQEGRILKLKYPDFTLINIYLPYGGRQKENLDYKLQVYKELLNYLKTIKNKNIILVGDFNIAHQEIDLARPKQNQNNIMFTPKERKQIDEIIKLGFIDSFRKFNKKPDNYTWWLRSFNARQRNLGWRLDYIFVSKKMALKLKKAFILNKVMGSDHCPVGIEVRG